MSGPAGKTRALSVPRRLICDLLHFARKVPTVPVQRRINVAALRAPRAALAERVSWCSLFLKAYARVAAATPALRQAYLSFPWPRLYEHPCNVVSLAVERTYRGEPVVLFGHVNDPEHMSLHAIEARLRRLKDEPVENLGLFRQALRLSRLPRPLRRLAWWVGLNVNGRQRAKRMGTFGLSVYSGLGAESLHPLSPLTTTLTYGVIDPDGGVTARIVYDHRVLDGATVARSLGLLEDVLNEDLVAELRGDAPPAGGGRDGYGEPRNELLAG